MNMTKIPVGIVPLGEVPELVLKIVAANISVCFKLHARILPAVTIPEFALDKRRLQYDAGIILKHFESMNFNNCDKIIGVLNEDLFVPIFSYVYGEAKQGGKFALVSLFRLNKNQDGSFPAQSLFYERAAKVALHEFGHLFNLFHCDEKRCLMHFSGDIQALDKTPLYLCRYCSTFF